MKEPFSLNDQLAHVLIESATQVFEKILNMEVTTEPWLLIDTQLTGDYSGNIYLIDYKERMYVATLYIALMEPALRYILYPIYGDEINNNNEALKDGIGEICNMVFTGVKSRLNDDGYSYILSLPVVMEGDNHIIKKRTSGKCLRIPFITNGYEFFIDASIDIDRTNITPEDWTELERVLPLMRITKD